MTSCKRVLLVDDDPSGRLTLAAVLEDAGFDVVDVDCLSSARQALERSAFEAAVLDLNLPDGRGPDLVPRLRERNPEIAVALLTGQDSPPEAGIDACFTKSAPTEALIDGLHAAMARPRGR